MDTKKLEKRVEKLKSKLKGTSDDRLASRTLRKQLKRAQRSIRSLKVKTARIETKGKKKKEPEKAA